MAKKQRVQCVRRCRDNKTGLRYHIGNTGDIDPDEPIAMYFKGFIPGTKVYHEIRGTKPKFDNNGNKLSDGTPIKITTRTVPGEVIEIDDLDGTDDGDDSGAGDVGDVGDVGDGNAPETFPCLICNKFSAKSPAGLASHQKTCLEKLGK